MITYSVEDQEAQKSEQLSKEVLNSFWDYLMVFP